MKTERQQTIGNTTFTTDTGSFRIFKKPNKIKVFVIISFLLFVYWLVPPVWRLKHSPVEVTRWIRSKGEVHAIVGPGQSDWIAAKLVSKHILHAIIVSEDAKFYTHAGLDFEQIIESLKFNIKRGRYARGASTITQQVVKMAFLSRKKSVIRKIREAIGAVLLEQMISKDQIIEWYLNLAEFGDGIYGLRAAAKHFFATKPELLTIQQGTHLALVLPSPNSWSKGLRQKSLTDFGQRRFAAIVHKMRRSGYITESQWLNCLATGNFGNPIQGYNNVLQAYQQAQQQKQPLFSSEQQMPKGSTYLFEELEIVDANSTIEYDDEEKDEDQLLALPDQNVPPPPTTTQTEQNVQSNNPEQKLPTP